MNQARGELKGAFGYQKDTKFLKSLQEEYLDVFLCTKYSILNSNIEYRIFNIYRLLYFSRVCMVCIIKNTMDERKYKSRRYNLQPLSQQAIPIPINHKIGV